MITRKVREDNKAYGKKRNSQTMVGCVSNNVYICVTKLIFDFKMFFFAAIIEDNKEISRSVSFLLIGTERLNYKDTKNCHHIKASMILLKQFIPLSECISYCWLQIILNLCLCFGKIPCKKSLKNLRLCPESNPSIPPARTV